jgi:hypothetical protein
MRAKADWGIGPPLARIEERRLLRYRRVVVPANRVDWYRSLFEEGGLFRPRRSQPHVEVLSDTGRRTVVQFAAMSPLFASSSLPGRTQPPRSASLPEGTGDLRHARAERGSTLGEISPLSSADETGRLLAQAPSRREGLVLKEERYPFPTCLHGFLTVPRAEREFYNLLLLRSLGFPAVEPLAFGHSGFWILYHRSFLITREVSEAINLKSWSRKQRSAFSQEEVERALMAFASELARLHRARCYLRTLYGKNVLLRRTLGQDLELQVCDVPRLWWFKGRGLSFLLASKDLACLDKWARRVFAPRVRVAFLKAYLESLGEGPPLRQWAARILRQGERLHHRTFLGWTSRKIKQRLKRWRLGNYWPF